MLQRNEWDRSKGSVKRCDGKRRDFVWKCRCLEILLDNFTKIVILYKNFANIHSSPVNTQHIKCIKPIRIFIIHVNQIGVWHSLISSRLWSLHVSLYASPVSSRQLFPSTFYSIRFTDSASMRIPKIKDWFNYSYSSVSELCCLFSVILFFPSQIMFNFSLFFLPYHFCCRSI